MVLKSARQLSRKARRRESQVQQPLLHQEEVLPRQVDYNPTLKSIHWKERNLSVKVSSNSALSVDSNPRAIKHELDPTNYLGSHRKELCSLAI